MNLDDYFESHELRQALSSPALRKLCGLHVIPMTPEEAMRDARQLTCGYGRDYGGVKYDRFARSQTVSEQDGRSKAARAMWAKRKAAE